MRCSANACIFAPSFSGSFVLRYFPPYRNDHFGFSSLRRIARIRRNRRLCFRARRTRRTQNGSIQIVSNPTLPLRSSSAQPDPSNASIWKVLPTAREKARLPARGIRAAESGTLTTRTQSPTFTSRPATSIGGWRVGVWLREIIGWVPPAALSTIRPRVWWTAAPSSSSGNRSPDSRSVRRCATRC